MTAQETSEGGDVVGLGTWTKSMTRHLSTFGDAQWDLISFIIRLIIRQYV